MDDHILCGEKDAIEEYQKGIKKRFNYSDMGRLKKHLGVWYKWIENEKGERQSWRPWISWFTTSSTCMKSTGYEVKHAGRPGTPGMSMIKYTESDSIEAIM